MGADPAASQSQNRMVAPYIGQMHRALHEAFAWGLLELLEQRAADHPLNDPDLWTRVEIVIRGDGTLDKVVTVRASGQAGFDEAVRELVIAAGPFPEPPPALRSANGKSYIQWAFHRDARACGTFGADPFILAADDEDYAPGDPSG